jgi:hypothetical protein
MPVRVSARDFLVETARSARDEGHFELVERAETAPVLFRQPVMSYVEHLHSTASLAREHMSGDEAATFDHSIGRSCGPGLSMAYWR